MYVYVLELVQRMQTIHGRKGVIQSDARAPTHTHNGQCCVSIFRPKDPTYTRRTRDWSVPLCVCVQHGVSILYRMSPLRQRLIEINSVFVPQMARVKFCVKLAIDLGFSKTSYSPTDPQTRCRTAVARHITMYTNRNYTVAGRRRHSGTQRQSVISQRNSL